MKSLLIIWLLVSMFFPAGLCAKASPVQDVAETCMTTSSSLLHSLQEAGASAELIQAAQKVETAAQQFRSAPIPEPFWKLVQERRNLDAFLSASPTRKNKEIQTLLKHLDVLIQQARELQGL